jgi:hypothetical protein
VNDIVNESCTCVGEPVAVGTSVTTITACDSYIWNETTYNASGVFTYETTNAAGCDSIATLILTIRQSSQAPQAAMASLNTISPGQSVTLTVNGGLLGTNAQWVWYSGSCGGTPVGQASHSPAHRGRPVVERSRRVRVQSLRAGCGQGLPRARRHLARRHGW